ncbi:MAG TPA: VOC family protein [Nostocaceae cyanobacterium]|nr:VOC family protein [Nostocaceae cyanobacterium]
MSDIGLTHVALEVSNINHSIAFYQKYAQMQVVHQRSDQASSINVAWISDLTRPFVIVLLEKSSVPQQPKTVAHLGVGCRSREEVTRLCSEAQAEGLLLEGPHDSGYPIGYWGFIRDPDGHILEVAYGQEVGLTVNQVIETQPKQKVD